MVASTVTISCVLTTWNLTVTLILFASGWRLVITLCTNALGSNLVIDWVIKASISYAVSLSTNSNSRLFKSPPKVGWKGYSVLLVNKRFLTACLTAAASAFL